MILVDPADLALLRAVNRGEFTINGLRNRDLQALLYAAPPADKSFRIPTACQVTDHRRLILNAVLSAERTTTQRLTAWAA